MSVVFVIFSFTVGGAETLLVDMINELEKKDIKVYLCVINKNYDLGLLKKVSPNVEILLLDRQEGGSKLKYMIKFAKFVLKNKIDIIHCQGINPVKFSILAKILRPKCKVFDMIHDAFSYLNLSSKDVLIDKLMCNKIVAISDIVKEQIISRGVKEEQVKKIYNAIDLNKFSPREPKEFDRNNIVIGSVARLDPEIKGQDVLLKGIAEVAKKYPNIKCMLAGDPPPGKEENLGILKELTKQLNIENNVEFLGKVFDVPKFLQSIDIFVLPSKSEGFGIALAEAMATGVPCIASDIQGPREIIKDNEYGLLFKTENPNDLAEKIIYMIENMGSHNEEKVIKYVRENFDLQFMIEENLNMFRL